MLFGLFSFRIWLLHITGIEVEMILTIFLKMYVLRRIKNEKELSCDEVTIQLQ